MSGPSKPLLLPRLAPHLFSSTTTTKRKMHTKETSSNSEQFEVISAPQSPSTEIKDLKIKLEVATAELAAQKADTAKREAEIASKTAEIAAKDAEIKALKEGAEKDDAGDSWGFNF
ncbi:hypothetical protein B0H13DRAFT_1907961 [Mycena leptocephala]|nr:hypothetical protein B0H13DRAFT_1907961 [Mycena leptocephala]